MTRNYVKSCKRDEQISMQLSIKTASYENLGSESFNLFHQNVWDQKYFKVLNFYHSGMFL